MKRFKILPVACLVAISGLMMGCSSGRHYGSHPPPPPAGSSFSLIISPYPGIPVSRYADGSYYYRSPQGYIYWRGRDNRYYIDRSHVDKRYRNNRDYRDWKNNGRRYSRKHYPH